MTGGNGSGGGIRGAIGAVGTLAGTLVIVAVFGAALVLGRPAASPSATEPPAAGAAPVTSPLAQATSPEPVGASPARPDGSPAPYPTAPSTGPTADPTGESTADPTGESTAEPTADPTERPTTDPTERPTPKVTPKPTPRKTPKPTGDPTPEGTPIISSVSGSFGETLTLRHIRITATPVDPDPSLAGLCRTDDPERQGWTELVALRMTITWPDPSDATDPWVAVGAHPWNALNWDPGLPVSGEPFTMTTCHKPGDHHRVLVELSPPGNVPMLVLRWHFS